MLAEAYKNSYFSSAVNYLKDILSGSTIIKCLVEHFHIIVAACLFVLALVPDKNWYNGYNTVIVLALLGIMLISSFTRGFDSGSLRGAVNPALYVFIALVAFMQATSLSRSLTSRSFVFYITAFLMTFIILYAVKTVDNINSLLDILLIGISLTGLYGVWQFVTHAIPFDPSLTDVDLNQGMPGRIFSTMGNPNNYAELLVLTLPFYFSAVMNAKNNIKKLLYMCLAVPPLAALAFTGSRSGWIAVACTIGVIVFFKNKKLIPILLVLGLTAIPFLPTYIYRRILTIFDPSDTSAAYRGLILDTVSPMFRDFWVTGLGLGSDLFLKISARYYQLTTKPPIHTHMLFLQIWLETGLAGIVSFLWFMVKSFRESIKGIYSDIDYRLKNIVIAGVAALAGILVMGLGEYVWFYPRLMMFFWVVVGIVLAALKVQRGGNGNVQ